ncbi:hypothetical protein BJY01DRAFT_235140 [Aspergillus pseudoustus]|uniref:Protein kinase domain-containing protein n=1 Tax=Aspergillus pseudoustus TaxID=1810923 RepID=A0ABR4JXP1_9EURO
MMSIEDKSALADWMITQTKSPTASKTDATGRIVYRSNYSLGPLRRPLDQVLISLALIANFGLSESDKYRAPEVILGCGWNLSAVIWNLSVMHLAEMISFLGPPLRDMAALSNAMISHKWPFTFTNDRYDEADNAATYFRGPFFDDDGTFLFRNRIPRRRDLPMTVRAVPWSEKDTFLSFVRGMLTWRPEDRKTARELLNHPWLSTGIV